MNYYHIRLVIHDRNVEELELSDGDKRDWIYFIGDSIEEIYVVSAEHFTIYELSSKLESLYKTRGFGIKDYRLISEIEFIEKIGKDRLGLLGSFILSQFKDEKHSLLPKCNITLELEKVISLDSFKVALKKYGKYLVHQSTLSQTEQSYLNETFFLIFNGEEGSGRKHAIRLLERFFGMKARAVNCKEIFIPKIEKGKFPVVSDFLEAGSRHKLEFIETLRIKEEANFCVIIANSQHEAINIRKELKETFYQVKIIDFPSYTTDELIEITVKMLQDRGIRSNPSELNEIFSHQSGMINARVIRKFVQTIYEFAIETGYPFNSQESINLELFEESVLQNESLVITAIEKLENMVSLKDVKESLTQELNYLAVRKLREQQNLPAKENYGHLMFIGNSGTGKTEVARLYTEMLFHYGVIKKNKFIKVALSDIIGKYYNDTGAKIRMAFSSAKGGVLFIDRPYQLIPRSERDYTKEAIAMIVQQMDKYDGDVLVVFAGQQEFMKTFLEREPSIAARISREILFDDYSAEELYEIFKIMLKERGYHFKMPCKTLLLSYFSMVKKQERYKNAHNARKLMEEVLYQQATRLMGKEIGTFTSEVLCEIVPSDIEAALFKLTT